MKYFMIFVGLLSLTIGSKAQSGVEKINLKGKVYTVSKNFPKEILGKYLYEGEQEPIIQLNENGEGLVQRHGVSPDKIRFWIDCDEKGNLRKQEGVNGRYGYTLLIQYLEGEEYDLMGIAVAKDLGQAIAWGERIKKLK